MFKVKTVNLAQLATAFPCPADIDSHYRRLQRFFKHVQFQPARMAPFVLAFLPDAPYTLALDRTQWMLGKIPINCLVLSVVHDGIAFPLFWQFLAKRGNSNTQERIELLGQFLKGTSKNASWMVKDDRIGHSHRFGGKINSAFRGISPLGNGDSAVKEDIRYTPCVPLTLNPPSQDAATQPSVACCRRDS